MKGFFNYDQQKKSHIFELLEKKWIILEITGYKCVFHYSQFDIWVTC